MRVSYLTMGFACISYLALGFAPTQVSAQLFRGSPFQRPAVNPQPAPNPAQPVPTAAPPQVPAGSNPSTAVTPPAVLPECRPELSRSDRAESCAAAN